MNFSDSDSKRITNPVIKTILAGVYGDDGNLPQLRGCMHIVQQIWIEVKKFLKTKIILPPEKAYNEDDSWTHHYAAVVDFNSESFISELYFTPICWSHINLPQEKYLFPDPSDININMMPFVVNTKFEACKLPHYLKPYWSLIKACIQPHFDRPYFHMWNRNLVPSDIGKVYYLTIQESWVEAGESQRRPGLHVDSPGYVKIIDDSNRNDKPLEGDGKSQRYHGHRWGNGCAHYLGDHTNDDEADTDYYTHPVYVMKGGIYIASSVPCSSRVWNCGVDPETVCDLGDIEHLRGLLPGEGRVLEPGNLYWITDKTPHESLPLKKRTYRQFFRLVTADVSLWYKDHSTANPLGVEPDPDVTKIVVGNKFSKEGVRIVEPTQIARERRARFLEELAAADEARCDWHRSYPGECHCHDDDYEDDDED